MPVVLATRCSETKHRKTLNSSRSQRDKEPGMVFKLELESGRSQDWTEGLHLRVRTTAKAGQLNGELAVSQKGGRCVGRARILFLL